jgi:hypothetical protein
VAADVVSVLLKLEQVRQFVSGADQASKAIGGVGQATEETGKKASLNWRSIAKWGGAATAVYGATRFLKGAVTQTEELGKSTLALNRTTGMDIKTSSEWAAVLKTRGIETTQFQRGMVTLSKQIEKTRKGTATASATVTQLTAAYNQVQKAGGKDAPAALEKLSTQIDKAREKGAKSAEIFRTLGVSMDAVKRGDVRTVLMQVADAFARMPNPAKRAALAQQLFSRAGIALAPILFKGSKAIREQLGLADKYGATLSGKSAKSIAEEIQHQRELRLAYMGVQVQLGTALLPVMLAVTRLVVALAQAMQPLTKNALALKVAVVAVAVAFVVYKAVMIAATIAEVAFNVQLGITAVLITGGVVLAIAALIAILYVLIKHWGAVKKASAAAWTWIKQNWPLLVGVLVGPFGLAIVLVIKHFDKIKAAARAAMDFVIRQFQRAVDFIKSIPSRIGSPFARAAHVGGGLLGRARGLLPGGQYGATVQRAGGVLVGERGPELVALPGAATVTPLTGAPTPLPSGGFGEARITTEVVLDRRVIAQAVGHYTADKLARR